MSVEEGELISVSDKELILLEKNPKKFWKKITRIGYCAFKDCTSLTNITIPNGVKSIGDYAFYGCTNLASITIPDSVTKIDDDIFIDCKNLTSVTFPDSVTEIGELSFKHLEKLKSIKFPKKVKNIGNISFSGCLNLESVTLPEGMTGIDDFTFYKCLNLKKVVIPESVTQIGSHVFCDCPNLTSITLPKGLTSIGEEAFFGCLRLTSITLPDGLTSIGKKAFYGCRSLTSLTFPDSVSEIEDLSFDGCQNLTSVKFPKRVKSMGSISFQNCTCLESISLPEGLTSISKRAFLRCPNLKEVFIPKSVTIIDSNAFGGCSSLKSITLPEGLSSIGEGAFDRCSALTDITIPKSVTTIGKRTFSECQSLANVIISEGVTSIGAHAFDGCSALTDIVLPKSVASIGDYAFSDCLNLKRITIPEGVTSIGKDVFFTSENLTELILPDSVTEIGDLKLRDFPNLVNVKFPKAVKSIGEISFSNCHNLETVTLPEGLTKINSYTFSFCKKLKSLTIPKSVTVICDDAAYGCENLKELVIPENVTSIGSTAFGCCSNLTSITIPNGVTSIGDSAFYGCTNVRRLTIPKHFIDHEELQFKILKELVVEGKVHPVSCIDDRSVFARDFEKYSPYVTNNITTKNVDELEEKGLLENLQNFKQYKTLFKKFGGEEEKYPANIHDLINLGINLGLFSNETIDFKTAGGKISKQKVSDLAYNVLQKLLSEGVPFSAIHSHFSALQPTQPNIEFLKFLSNKNILNEALEEERQNPGFITRTAEWFEERKAYNMTAGDLDMPNTEENRYKVQVMSTSDDGVDRLHWKAPSVEYLRKEFSRKKFTGITPETRNIADAISLDPHYDQKHFDKAVEIEKERQKKGSPTRLTKKKIGQTIDEAWKEYFEKSETLREEIVAESEKVAATQASAAHKIFTYEMLEKNDPMFYNIGSLTSCCARLFGAGAGAQRATIVSPDMQALAIRDAKGNITAFSIVYVNRAEGYAVLNDIEVNKSHEDKEEELDAIYKAAVDGVHAFVEQYDREEEERAAKEEGYVARPIKKVTCGISPNWSGGINERIRENPESEIMPAPSFDDYKYAGSGSWSGDWHREQYVIYDREKEKGGKSDEDSAARKKS